MATFNMKEFKASNCDLIIIVDDEDFDLVMSHNKNWAVSTKGNNLSHILAWSFFLKKTVYLNRIIFGAHNEIPPKMEIDHKDRNVLNNQKYNLRLATHAQNVQNRKSLSHRKYKGVYRYFGEKYYQVIVETNGNRYVKRGFKTQEEAARHANEKFKELYGDFAFQNEI